MKLKKMKVIATLIITVLMSTSFNQQWLNADNEVVTVQATVGVGGKMVVTYLNPSDNSPIVDRVTNTSG